MTDQTQATLATATAHVDFAVDARDRVVLRRLAGRMAELAARPVEAEKRALWYRHNALEETRPVVFCDPENGWNEIITGDALECRGDLARQWEMHLRKEIFWGESMGDDRVVEPMFPIHYAARESDWGLHEIKHGGERGGSYVWDAPLKSYDELDKLRFPTIAVDYDATGQLKALAEDVLGDLLAVEVRGSWWWTLGMTWTAITLRGLEQFMLDMCLYPEELKRLMAFLRDGTLAKLDFLEQQGLLSLNTGGTYVGSGGFGYTRELPQPDFHGKVRTRDMWGFAESQETTSVSPDQFEEFVFPYQRPILERFGLNCYGCCEPLDLRWHVVRKFSRLRRVSVSPWADPSSMADKLGGDYIFSYKPNPASLAVPTIDEESIRRGLRQVFEIAGGCRLEVIMKDNHTIGGNPQNVVRWCAIAREEADRSRRR